MTDCNRPIYQRRSTARLPTLLTALLTIVLVTPVLAAANPFEDAYAAQTRGDYRAAIRLYSEALESGDLAPASRAAAYLNRGSAYGIAGLMRKAVDDFDAAVGLDPRNASAIASRATARFMLGQLSAAYLDFNKAHALEPADAYTSLWLEITRLRLDRPDLGTLAATTALRDPGKWPSPIIDVFLGRAQPASLEVLTGESTKSAGKTVCAARRPSSLVTFVCNTSNLMKPMTGLKRQHYGALLHS